MVISLGGAPDCPQKIIDGCQILHKKGRGSADFLQDEYNCMVDTYLEKSPSTASSGTLLPSVRGP